MIVYETREKTKSTVLNFLGKFKFHTSVLKMQHNRNIRTGIKKR